MFFIKKIKKLISFFLFFLAISNSTNLSFARNVWVDSKEKCEKTNGNWRVFNNDCADSCQGQFGSVVCNSTSIYSCDCGSNKCWDDNQCLSNKISQTFWQKKADEIKEAREKELEKLRLETIRVKQQIQQIQQQNQLRPNQPPKQQFQQQVQQQDYQSNQPKRMIENNLTKQNQAEKPVYNLIADKVIDSINKTEAEKEKTINNQKIDNQDLLNLKITKEDKAEIVPQNKINAQKNEDNQLICKNQNGNWKQFNNGCVASCSFKISKSAICTQALTFGCECGENKCWDNNTKSCLQIEEYRKSLTKNNQF